MELFQTDYLAPMLAPANLTDLLESSDVVGNIRFSHPTLYVFPGGQGDAALFGINGFNMLSKFILFFFCYEFIVYSHPVLDRT